ncbi:MAG: c-type cytochrome [Gammaproteobacteria bacterium]|nr:c-type cytochrome [Gammaproteobacteria bacterium]NNC76311.1 c-type cytochrome [Woeseiaceae bacterium]
MMGDMPSDFWSGWIIVVTLVSLAGLAWVIFSIYSPANEPEHEGDDGPVWDETLREGDNPAPFWWFWLILSLMVLSVLYLMLYPGLGSFQGALKWSQGGRMAESNATYEAEFGGTRRLIAEVRIETLQDDAALMRSAQRIYDRNCAVCHGYEGEGQAQLFPSLADAEWQWGGSHEQVETSIRAGRKAVMVGWTQALGGDAGVRNVADYIKVIGSDAAEGHPGQAQYNLFCTACHGVDGGGNTIFGAPSLADDIWLYGDSDDALAHSIGIGRNGEMPAFESRLDDTQIRLLVALLTR